MRSSRSRNALGIILLLVMLAIIVLPACREEREPLDRNRAPQTYLTVAPPETTEADYRVHLYWYGEDHDGVVTRYMWFRSDTLRTLRPDLEPEMELLDWNPEARASDYVRGRFTTATDTVIIFTGYDDETAALLNRQAFHIVAIDDVGRMDPTPARVQFNAKVDCVPVTKFWTSEAGGAWKPFVIGQLDTLSMFTDICIKFIATTCNNYITGYRWIYGGETYPDINNDGIPDWYIPELAPPETVTVCIENDISEFTPSGDFYFKVIARDEAGALSRSNTITGEGVCQVVINFDPDTRITHGVNFFTKQDGDTAIRTIDFKDEFPDTVPYNSRLRMHYVGRDDSRDILQYTDPPIPIRFQYMFGRRGNAVDGGVSSYTLNWMPAGRAENTNCFADEDSVTMRIGTYDYFFASRSFDEQYRSDGTPDTIRFMGNFPPVIDLLEIGVDNFPRTPSIEYTPISSDTLYVNIGTPFLGQGDTLNAYNFLPNYQDTTITFYFKFFVRAIGHDDYRERPGSGVRSWRYSIDSDEHDYYYRQEDEWISTFPVDTMMQECIFLLTTPMDTIYTSAWPDTDFVDTPPPWLGENELVVTGKDIKASDTFMEGIRATSPEFDPEDPCVMIKLGEWFTIKRYPSNYAKFDTQEKTFYMKLIYAPLFRPRLKTDTE